MTRTVIDGLTVAHHPAPSLTLRTGSSPGFVTLLTGADLTPGIAGRVLTIGGRVMTLGSLTLALEP